MADPNHPVAPLVARAIYGVGANSHIHADDLHGSGPGVNPRAHRQSTPACTREVIAPVIVSTFEH